MRNFKTAALAAFLLTSPLHAQAPTLREHGNATQLMVHGAPFLILGGELGNSSASGEAYMAPHWARLKAMHLNAVLASVSWELIEPEEGRFDWTSVDFLLRDARAHDMKLVLLWFGAWKNSMSTYVPSWVKRDQARFPRATIADGTGVEILSAHGKALLDADSKAFAALMAHLKQVDGAQNSVLMVQVENEMGMLPIARDHGALAQAAFSAQVPPELGRYLDDHRQALVPALRTLWESHGARTKGSWAELFGGEAAGEEVFTAWHYARFADQLAAAGKAAYDLPMFVNVALNRPGKAPGDYPSGGPLPHLIDIWKAAAPRLDFLAPDIYFDNFADLVARYHRGDNPLFIPEGNSASNAVGPANALFAIGAHDAIGFAPFSIESIDEQPNGFGGVYAMLDQLAPFILEAQGKGRIAGFKAAQDFDGTVHAEPTVRTIGGYRFSVSYEPAPSPQKAAEAAGMIIQTGPEDYLIAGQGITVTFEPVAGGKAGIDFAWEGHFEDGAWVNGRRLNGDQTHQGRHIRIWPGDWSIQKVRLYSYK